jgi:hypothetical protein
MARFFRRYWGYLALILAFLGWTQHVLGFTLILIVSLLALLYFLVQAPLSCMALNRDGTFCRNNSRGLLVGCRQVRQHKWQRLRDFFISRSWQKTLKNLTASPATTLGTVGALASLVPLCGALLAHV